VADIRDWGKFLRGRWDWTKSGYEDGFPRRSQFTDLDAAIEFDGRRLVIETKHHDGSPGRFEPPDTGQSLFLRDELSLGKTVFVLYGCGACNDPHGLRIYGGAKLQDDEVIDWRGLPKSERRRRFKRYIDWAMGLAEKPVEGQAA
jgi:hypothetical protein